MSARDGLFLLGVFDAIARCRLQVLRTLELPLVRSGALRLASVGARPASRCSCGSWDHALYRGTCPRQLGDELHTAETEWPGCSRTELDRASASDSSVHFDHCLRGSMTSCLAFKSSVADSKAGVTVGRDVSLSAAFGHEQMPLRRSECHAPPSRRDLGEQVFHVFCGTLNTGRIWRLPAPAKVLRCSDCT